MGLGTGEEAGGSYLYFSQLPITNYQLPPITNHQSPITNHRF
ncbi:MULTISPECIES: hypothetical protein [Sphaerospermopsis]|nr:MULTISPECIES: hypothetical protein [Sphaerospermopsis]